MLLRLYKENPEQKRINAIVDCLKNGGVIIYPTDTVYGLGCDIYNLRAIERLCKIKGINPKKSNLAIVCHDFSHLSDFAAAIDTPVFRVMKKALPGPFTFILKANGNVPKIFKQKNWTAYKFQCDLAKERFKKISILNSVFLFFSLCFWLAIL